MKINKQQQNSMKKEGWTPFKEAKWIGVDYDCKGNPLLEWKEVLKLKSDKSTNGYDFIKFFYCIVLVNNPMRYITMPKNISPTYFILFGVITIIKVHTRLSFLC